MFDHVTLRAADLPTAEERLQALLDPLAMDETTSTGTFAVWGDFMLTAADSEHPPAERVHVAFVAPSREAVAPGGDDAVRRFYADATAAGYAGNGEPGERPRYHPGYYAAYVLDPDGHNVEVVSHHH